MSEERHIRQAKKKSLGWSSIYFFLLNTQDPPGLTLVITVRRNYGQDYLKPRLVILLLRRLRQEDYNFMASLSSREITSETVSQNKRDGAGGPRFNSQCHENKLNISIRDYCQPH